MKNKAELKSWFEDDKLYVGEYVKHKINQLDKPETLSQGWIDEHKVDYHNWIPAVPIDYLQNLLVPKQGEITHKQVEKYLLDKNIRVIDIDIYEEMQSELEELKNGVTLSKTETVADVISDFWKSFERLKEVMSMEVEELEE